MKLKKGLSLLLSLAMLISVLPFTVSAAGKGKVSLVYMEYKSGMNDMSWTTSGGPVVEEKAVPSGLESKSEHEFLLGIKLSDFSNIAAAASNMNLFGLGIKYDPDYIEVLDTVSGTLYTTMQWRMGYMSSPDPILNMTSGYGYTNDAMAADKTTADGKKAVTIVLANNTNPGYNGTQSAYAGIIKMKLKNPSAAKASGEQLFSIVSGEDTNVSFGIDGAAGSYIYGTGDSRMEDIVDFAFPELFPIPETEVSAEYKSGSFSNLSSLTVGNTLNKATIKFEVTTSKANSSEKSATGLFYGPASKTTKADMTGEITGGVTKAMSGSHLYAIYEKDTAFGIKDLGEMTVREAKALQSIAINGTVANTTYGTAFTLPDTSLTYNEDYTQASDATFKNAVWQIKVRGAADSTYATYTAANEAKRAAGDYTLRASTTYNKVTKYSDPVDVSIAQKSITITSISGVTPIKVNGNPEVTGTATGNAITATGLVSGDSISVTYKATYTTPGTASTSAAVTISDLALADSVPSKNYTLSATTATGTGTVSDTVTTLEGIAIATQPKLTYAEGDTLDLSDLKVTVNTKVDGTPASSTINYDDTNLSYAIDGKTVANGDTVTADMADKTITVTYNAYGSSKTAATNALKVSVEAAPAQPPTARTIAVDKATNNVVVTNPEAGLEYAIAEVTEPMVAPAETDYSTTTTFTGLKKDTKYVVYARVAATGDVLASSAVPSNEVKTFKNKITILNSGETVLSEGYSDDVAELSQDALHQIVTAPSRLDAYYEEAALSTKVEFPIALNADLTLYAKIKKSTGGGGGGGGWSVPATPSLALNQKTLSGHAGDTVTLRATLSNSTSKITWESDNEEVATVDENGVVTFVAVGTATITATAGTLKETAEVTVLADDIPVPTEESLIDEKYTGAYVYGYEDGTFGPAREITRAEVVAMVSRLLKNPIDENRSYDTNFTDVAEGAWYKNYIGFLAQYNIVEGYGDGTFAPANKITRAEMTAILARAAKFQLTGNATTFSDVNDSFWAKAYIATMAEKGLVNGYPDGTFAPNKNITRAETVTILNRMLDDSTVNGSVIPADVDSSYWAYNDIVKAMNDRVLR